MTTLAPCQRSQQLRLHHVGIVDNYVGTLILTIFACLYGAKVSLFTKTEDRKFCDTVPLSCPVKTCSSPETLQEYSAH